jgi:Eukaryotic cytochrome b561
LEWLFHQDIPTDDSAVTVLFAHGSGAEWAKHSTRGAKRVVFATCDVSDVSVAPLRVAHGVCMSVGFGMLLPAGVVIALFGRDKQPSNGPKAWWFVRHRAIQSLGLCAVIAGFVLALVFKSEHREHFTSTHGQIGLAVFVAAILQPINAAVRPHTGTPFRRVWSLFHKSLGYGCVLLALANIFLGLRQLQVPVANTLAIVVIVLLSVAVACACIAYHHHRKVHHDVVQLSDVPSAQKESTKHLTTPGVQDTPTGDVVTVEITHAAARSRDKAPTRTARQPKAPQGSHS